jgi:uncharacterized protein with PIN domain
MAILCSNCQRQYDATLFQFGRTIDCACGSKVGLETRINLPPSVELKFFADVNVGRLTRWLRALGFDTIWEDAIADGDLVRRAIVENRYILTLDKRLPEEWRVNNVLLLKSEEPLEQLREVVEHFKIKKPIELFTRCLMCNTKLRLAAAEEIVALVPRDIQMQRQTFHYCLHCRKIYWEGSHTTRMQMEIENVFNARQHLV